MSLPIDAQVTFVYTRDLAVSARFYEDVLGFGLTLDQGSCRIYAVVENKSYLGICENASASEKPEGIIITIVTQEVDAWYERITSMGVDCEHPPRENPTYGIYHFFLRDPNGYLIEVQRFLDPNWTSK